MAAGLEGNMLNQPQTKADLRRQMTFQWATKEGHGKQPGPVCNDLFPEGVADADALDALAVVQVLGEDDRGILRICGGDDQSVPKRQMVVFLDLTGV
jgi:hypothetical protein